MKKVFPYPFKNFINIYLDFWCIITFPQARTKCSWALLARRAYLVSRANISHFCISRLPKTNISRRAMRGISFPKLATLSLVDGSGSARASFGAAGVVQMMLASFGDSQRRRVCAKKKLDAIQLLFSCYTRKGMLSASAKFEAITKSKIPMHSIALTGSTRVYHAHSG